MLMDICSQGAVQGSIWDTVDREKHKRLMEVLDRTNDKYGRNTLKLAVLGDGEQWKIKQERLSPCYTTRMVDFLKRNKNLYPFVRYRLNRLKYNY